MQYKQEEFTFKKGEYVRMFQSAKRQETLHCHDCLELNLVESGSGTYVIDGRLYEIAEGDIFVINNSEHHLALHQSGELVITVLILETGPLWSSAFGVNYLKPFLGRNTRFSNRIAADEEDSGRLRQLFSWLKEELLYEDGTEKEQQPEQAFLAEAEVNLLLSLLCTHYEKKKELAGENAAASDYRLGPAEKVFSYINEHFTEKVTLEELADECALSRSYLSRYFKKLTGQTLFSYIQQTRLQYAAYLLQTGKKSITEIATESGFENLSYFNRIFKKNYGMAPGKFRKTGNNDKTVENITKA